MTPPADLAPPGFAEAARAIVAVGGRLAAQGLTPATAGNFSMRLEDGTLAITVSSAHKSRLSPAQVMRTTAEGAPLGPGKPSAETRLHALIYALDPTAGAVLHTHSVAGTVLSRSLAGADAIVFEDYELLKAFPGITTHRARLIMPLVDNAQDMAALADELAPILARQAPMVPAFYIRGHGLYAWGPDIDAAESLTEACEFLLACTLEEHRLGRAAG